MSNDRKNLLTDALVHILRHFLHPRNNYKKESMTSI